MSLYKFLTTYIGNGQLILVYCYGSAIIDKERCRDVLNNDKYKEFMKKDVSRILSTNSIPDTIVIYIE